jgi:hypothetical protein
MKSLENDAWEGGSDISAPTRDWTSRAGSAQEDPVLAIGDNRACYLRFSRDHFIFHCPNLTAEQGASILRRRATQSQNGGLVYGQKQQDRPIGNSLLPCVSKPMGQTTGH